jgi:NAD(P)-dependent dehydrogenase (short-subunit alcohol dehydrogenase family)
VAITGRREDAGQDVVDEITRNGGEALFVKADATDFGGARAVVQQVVNRFGRLDVAFNNAGTAAAGPLTELDETAWDHLMDGNLKGTFFYLQAEADQMKRQGKGGAIVVNGSVFAELGTPGISIYSASKGGVASRSWCCAGSASVAACTAWPATPRSPRPPATAISMRPLTFSQLKPRICTRH